MIKESTEVQTVVVNQFHCDGPIHPGETFMDSDTITLDHGYGSPYDGEKQHFCSLDCARDWLAEHVQKSY